MRKTPLIGVTTYLEQARWGAWDVRAAVVQSAYLEMVEAGGGQPVLLPPPTSSPHGATSEDAVAAVRAGPFLESLDGLVLAGGADVAPARYGAEADPALGTVRTDRDAAELALLAAALDRDMPVLAICRGVQVLNVACGGDLIQHLPDRLGHDGHQPGGGRFGKVRVAIDEGSSLAGILGTAADVSCSHHQAIARLGTGLVVVARSTEGVVEAVEMPGRRFVVGVQWHPEQDREVRLFSALVEAAGGLAKPEPLPASAERIEEPDHLAGRASGGAETC
ncbi:MAG: gamma-glutamyl-gamma-aminobutyrate hydrolase family protein [Actinomycetota bacterium]|nr:gamma-glutamyl-gamma-aminobutyrate hydrolase family protein [Actinomycetota bacterium]